jgi:hypothetical protein
MKNGSIGVFLRRKKKTEIQISLEIYLQDMLTFTDLVQEDTVVKYTYIAVVFIIKDMGSHVNISSR